LAYSGLDFNSPALALLSLGQRHVQDTVAVGGLYLVGVNVRRQEDGLVKLLLTPLAVATLLLLRLSLMGRAENQMVAAYLDVEVGRFKARSFRADDDAAIVLLHIQLPMSAATATLPRAKPAGPESIKEAVELLPESVERLEAAVGQRPRTRSQRSTGG